jgi:hypothetical protein
VRRRGAVYGDSEYDQVIEVGLDELLGTDDEGMEDDGALGTDDGPGTTMLIQVPMTSGERASLIRRAPRSVPPFSAGWSAAAPPYWWWRWLVLFAA